MRALTSLPSHLYFSKAFDTISHSILLEKLAAFGLDGCTGGLGGQLGNGVTCSWQPVTRGVPRAQCLGRSFIFINDLDMGLSAPSVSLQMTTKMGGSVDLLEGRQDLQRDLDWLDW